MNSLLLSRLSKDFLNQEFETIPARQRNALRWSGSTLAPHPKATFRKLKKSGFVFNLKERFASLFHPSSAPAVYLSTSPRLTPPIEPAPASYRPPCYFSRGALDTKPSKNPLPITYLLTETNETSKARPVPGNSLIFRSLCKGKGRLKKSAQGLVYLDIDNQFILTLLPYLQAHGLVRPPYFNLFNGPDGAHIPVIPAREMAFQYLDQINELEKEFSFEIEGLYSMEPSSWPEVEQVWFFKIRSSQLENLRRSYFLSSLPAGHSFHIAVAVKPRTIPEKAPIPLMRINIGILAA